MTGAGYTDSGLMIMRRAIEFACYAAKASRSKQRAVDWMDQRTDVKARARFAASCSIPLSYTSDQYRYLRPLIVAWDLANYYGAHGNFESLTSKCSETREGHVVSAYQAPKEEVPRSTGYIILLGYRLLLAFRQTLSTHLLKVDKFSELLRFTSHAVRQARLTLAREEYLGNVPSHVLTSISLDDQDEVDCMFNELVGRETERYRSRRNGSGDAGT